MTIPGTLGFCYNGEEEAVTEPEQKGMEFSFAIV